MEIIAVSFLLILTLLVIIYFFFDFLAYFLGGPFVPTPKSEIKKILDSANFKRRQVFYEVGGGLGLVAISAVKKYQLDGVVIEINPLLITFSKLVAYLMNTKVTYINKNLFNVPLKNADVIYIYLLPGSVNKLAKKLIKECRGSCLIISKRFQIKPLNDYLSKTITINNSPVYFYLLKKR